MFPSVAIYLVGAVVLIISGLATAILILETADDVARAKLIDAAGDDAEAKAYVRSVLARKRLRAGPCEAAERELRRKMDEKRAAVVVQQFQ